MKLNRNRPFGRITPPWQDHDMDRPAFYEQDGKFYDQHDRLIERGKPLRPIAQAPAAPVEAPTPQVQVPMPPTVVEEPTPTQRDPLDHDGNGHKGGSLPASDLADTLTAADLLANAAHIPWPTFRKAAQRILGSSCPASKKAILDELKKAAEGVDDFADVQARNARPRPAAVPKQPAGPVTIKGGVTVDLAAWGRGQKDYLWSEVQKAIRQQYHKQVTERRDALDFLIEEGVITADSARKDIK